MGFIADLPKEALRRISKIFNILNSGNYAIL